MLQTSIARLYEDNAAKLGLDWVSGRGGVAAPVRRDSADAAALVGHLNLIHPNRIQVLGRRELAYIDGYSGDGAGQVIANLFAAEPAAIILTDGVAAPAALLRSAEARSVPVLATASAADAVIDTLRRYLAKILADSTSMHGVFMDVLGLGVLITGESGVGKSELALELISRGRGLVADDVVEISRIAAKTLEGRCPPVLKDFLEVRGLGVLNIRTIFGETAVRPKMNLKLIVHLEKPGQAGAAPTERLPLHELTEDILRVSIRKIIIPVAAGRNLAVLLEAAVRNYILQLRGIDSTQEFIARQQGEIKRDG
ncbi:MAG: HPr kinase/phosphorylase [Betaproteobacteria bacterium]|nr:MAG: HPr kinase/phosphorylase [Betaproteobacteria bacterium]